MAIRIGALTLARAKIVIADRVFSEVLVGWCDDHPDAATVSAELEDIIGQMSAHLFHDD